MPLYYCLKCCSSKHAVVQPSVQRNSFLFVPIKCLSDMIIHTLVRCDSFGGKNHSFKLLDFISGNNEIGLKVVVPGFGWH